MDFEIIKAQWEELATWKKLLLVVLISIGIGYLVYMFIISEKIKERDNLKEEMENTKVQLQDIMRNATPEKRAQLQQELEKEKEKTELLKAQLEELKNKFLPKDNPQKTLVFITRQVEKNNLVMNRFVINNITDVYLRYNPATEKIEYITENNGGANPLVPKKPKFEKLGNEKGNNNNNKTEEEDMPKVHLKKVSVSINVIGSPSDIFSFIKNVSYTKNYVRIERVSLNKGSKTDILNADIDISSFFSPEINKNSAQKNKSEIYCKMKETYQKCNNLAKSQKIMKDFNECSQLSENFVKNADFVKGKNQENSYQNADYKKNINSACFAGCVEDENFIKNIQKKCN